MDDRTRREGLTLGFTTLKTDLATMKNQVCSVDHGIVCIFNLLYPFLAYTTEPSIALYVPRTGRTQTDAVSDRI